MNGYKSMLENLRKHGNFRTIPQQATGDEIDFSTNDYLGLSARLDLQAEFLRTAAENRIPLTSVASRLLASRQREYSELESKLESLYCRKALVFNSGYHANTGLISGLSEGKTLVLADRLVHASIIDGIKLSGCRWQRWRHNDTAHLRCLLEKEHANYERCLIVAESVYSMDGDTAPIADLIAIKCEFPGTLLYIDEAHGVGVRGALGLGECRDLPQELYNKVDVVIGTFGKAWASSGAFAVMSPILRDVAVNRARSFIFSTALPPICCAWTTHVLTLNPQFDAERRHLRQMSLRLARGLKDAGIGVAEPSHIMPVVIGEARRTVEIARRLSTDFGLKVLPIRTPTVPPGTERLRISLSAWHTAEHIDRLTAALKKVL